MEAANPARSVEETLKLEEIKRRKREGIVILVTALMVAALIFFEVQLPDASPEYSMGSNIVFFLLINVNIILLGLLAFLVIRNLVKLIVERRQRILGSRLQARLVLAFVALSLVPSVLLFTIAGGLLTRSVDRWFDSKVESALQGSLEIGQTYYQNSANNAIFYARQLSQQITKDGLFDGRRAAELKEFVQNKQREYNLGTVELFAPDGQPFVVAFNQQVPTGVTVKPEPEFLNRALRGLEVTRTQIFGDADVIRGGVPIYGPDRRILGVVVVDYYVPKSISKRALQISQSYEQYKYLMFLKTPVKNSYLLTMLLITLVIIFAAGVISIDPAGMITTWNKAAEQMLGVRADQALGQSYRDVFRAESLGGICEIVESVERRESVELELKLSLQEQLLTLMVNAATLRDDDNSILGVMLFLEDITQIQKVQRMEAWREVARRIAHEIKNPLTPIQLSAERLRKRYAKMLGGDGAILDKCTTTIIHQVDELKNLVNEFSQFARLPSAQLMSNDLNEIVSDALVLFKEGHQDTEFEFRGGVIPRLELDREQIKRVLINLLDNAVAAVDDRGRIKLTTSYDRDREVVTLEVADDGCGLAPEIRTKIFEPYFSTKDNGTGLGLTIVSQIIEDHRGYIRALPNDPRGTRFTIEFPVVEEASAEEVTKRAVHS